MHLEKNWDININYEANKFNKNEAFCIWPKEIGLKYIEEQIGMFGFLKLNIKQIDELIHKYHIYLPYDGRISIAGLNSKNIDYFKKSLSKVLNI